MKTLSRRDFLRILGAGGLYVASPFSFPTRASASEFSDYSGPVFVTIAAAGGWDVTSFCDPKVNIAGELEISRWNRTDEPGSITGSEVTYAPVGNNQAFFERFHGDMLVLNGIDSQTNSHDVGVRHNWSGKVAAGYPSFSAIVAGVHGTDMPLPYLTNANYRETGGLATYAEIQGARDLQDLLDVNRAPHGDRLFHDPDEVGLIEAFRRRRLERELADPNLLPRRRRALESVAAARASRDQLSALAVSLPSEPVNPFDQDGFRNPLLQQAQLALVCLSSGITVAADLEIGGFDTHGNHDTNHTTALRQLTNGITYVWDYAEELGIADRLVVLVTSDFGRTPWYNDGNGKDHWPVNSAVIMSRNELWTNRVVGLTDEGHGTLPLDATTLEQGDEASGVTLKPGHVQSVMRRIANVDTPEIDRAFPLDVESIDIMGV